MIVDKSSSTTAAVAQQELASNSLCHFVGFFKKEKGFNPHHHPNHGV
jgi:hypothetical protein